MLNHGYLPRHYLADAPARLLRAYVESYIKEEVLWPRPDAEPSGLRGFPDARGPRRRGAGQLRDDRSRVRRVGPHRPGVLPDPGGHALGRFLPAFTKRPKRRVIGAPKFYFADVGIVNVLAGRGALAPGAELFGKAFENWVFHELTAASHYRQRYVDLVYWRLASGIEVDFVIGDMRCAVEAKAASRITSDHLKGLRQLAVDQPSVRRRVVASLEPSPRVTEDGIDILPWRVFLDRLWSGELWGE